MSIFEELKTQQLKNQALIKSQFLETDIEKGKYIGSGQPGERRQFKDGWYTKQDSGKWKKDKEQSENTQEKPKKEEAVFEKYKDINSTLHEKFNKVKDKIQGIISSNTPKTEQLKDLIGLGFSDEEALVALTTLPLSHILTYKKENNIQGAVSSSIQTKLTDSISQMPSLKAEDRWSAYDGYLDMVLENEARGLICYGRGGVGKSYTLLKKLENATNPDTGAPMKEYDVELDNLPQEYDYVKISGKATAVGVYQALYEYNGKLLIFDDCDSVLEDKDSLMMLKAVLDTSGDQVVTYSTSSKIKDSFGNEIPQKFKFKGRIVFISNIPTDKFNANPHLAAVKTRNLTIDLSMTPDETMDRLKAIMPKMIFQNNEGKDMEVTDEVKQDVFNFILKYKDKTNLTNLNARVFGNIAKIRTRFDKNPNAYGGVSWENVALNLLS